MYSKRKLKTLRVFTVAGDKPVGLFLALFAILSITFLYKMYIATISFLYFNSKHWPHTTTAAI